MKKWIKDLWDKHPKKKWLVIGLAIGVAFFERFAILMMLIVFSNKTY